MLDAASLWQLFTKLEGRDLAACAAVCKSWCTVACSEPLWQRQCEELQPSHLFREDVWEELGRSYRRYYCWANPRIRGRVNRLCILDNNSGSGQTKLVLTEVGHPSSGAAGGSGSSSGGYIARGSISATPPGSYMGGSASKPTWSPVGGLVAYSSLQRGRMSVMVMDCRGRMVAETVLEDPPLPAFYLHWAPCGTRLLFLTAWPAGPVALKAWDIGPALVGGGSGDGAGRLRKPVLLGTARPLFLTCSPSCTRVLWHGNGRDYGLVDCATCVDEDGAEHDRFFCNPLPGGAHVPQWVRDAQGREWMLLTVLLEQGDHAGQQGPGGGGGGAEAADAEPAGELLLVPVEALEEAYEMGGSVLSVGIMRSISTLVCRLGDVQNCSFAANRDASIVAWTESHRVAIRFTGAAERMFRLELPARQPPAPVLAMQWSPDGRKLLLLVLEGNDWFWVVWHAPGAPPPDDVPDAQLAAPQLGCLMVCQPHQPSATFQSEYLPFMDQFAQTLQLWSPDSNAFCYAAVDAVARPSLRDIGRESSYVYVQPIPSTEQLEALAGGRASDSSSREGRAEGSRWRRRGARLTGEMGAGPALAVHDAPTPSRIMPGSITTWSFT